MTEVAAFVLVVLLAGIALAQQTPSTVSVSREFRIDYDNDQFLMDGQPFRYVSGSLHYFRVPAVYWRDRLKKLTAAGLNAVSTYVEWSQHEPSQGVYNFEGDLDLLNFIRLAQEEGLYVLLRPGPYICAERDMGGFPAWLLSVDPNIKLRTNDTNYLEYVERWMNVLLLKVKPLLYGNGGPIIMVQVENEYGSYYACDKDYLLWLRDLFKQHVEDAAVLYTTDGAGEGYLKCGKIPDVYATVDFGSGDNVTKAFAPQRKYEPRGPLVNSEYYTGWLSHWEEPYQRVATKAVADTLRDILAANASVNFYMFFGGTNFGFLAGANDAPNGYNPQLTTYDYDAPLTEAGDPTDKYLAIREVIGQFMPLPDVPVPTPSPKGQYGEVDMHPVAGLMEIATRRAMGRAAVFSDVPLSFEALAQRYGFVLYETVLSKNADPAVLSVPGLRDRAVVMVDQTKMGVLSRSHKAFSIPLQIFEGQTLALLVENQGRINFGLMNDTKGIISNVTLDDDVLLHWTMTGFPLSSIEWMDQQPVRNVTTQFPAFFRGTFRLPDDEEPLDTFLHTGGWGKGVAFVNGYNLGRYWPRGGPQVTLFVPSTFLLRAPSVNTITVLEIEGTNGPAQMHLVASPKLDERVRPRL